MSADRTVKVFDIVKHLGANFISGAECLADQRSVVNEEKKLSIAGGLSGSGSVLSFVSAAA